MDDMTCPHCQETMHTREVGEVSVAQCAGCRGIFLARSELGALTEAERDFHAGSGPETTALPRITADMTAPPPSARSTPRSYLQRLFD